MSNAFACAAVQRVFKPRAVPVLAQDATESGAILAVGVSTHDGTASGGLPSCAATVVAPVVCRRWWNQTL